MAIAWTVASLVPLACDRVETNEEPTSASPKEAPATATKKTAAPPAKSDAKASDANSPVDAKEKEDAEPEIPEASGPAKTVVALATDPCTPRDGTCDPASRPLAPAPRLKLAPTTRWTETGKIDGWATLVPGANEPLLVTIGGRGESTTTFFQPFDAGPHTRAEVRWHRPNGDEITADRLELAGPLLAAPLVREGRLLTATKAGKGLPPEHFGLFTHVRRGPKWSAQRAGALPTLVEDRRPLAALANDSTAMGFALAYENPALVDGDTLCFAALAPEQAAPPCFDLASLGWSEDIGDDTPRVLLASSDRAFVSFSSMVDGLLAVTCAAGDPSGCTPPPALGAKPASIAEIGSGEVVALVGTHPDVAVARFSAGRWSWQSLPADFLVETIVPSNGRLALFGGGDPGELIVERADGWVGAELQIPFPAELLSWWRTGDVIFYAAAGPDGTTVYELRVDTL